MIIAVVGKNVSGKDYFLEHLSKKFNLPIFSIGDIARELAENEGLEKTRENLHFISNKYMSKFGNDYFPNQMIKKINSTGYKNVLVSGIRPLSDVKKFISTFGDEFYLVAVVVVDDQVRFERTIKRASERDPQSFEKFLEYDQNEEKLFQTSQTIELADMVLFNDGTSEQFLSEIEWLYRNFLSRKFGI